MPLKSVKLNYPSAKDWMWNYCIYLGPWTDKDGHNYDMGVFKKENGYSAACVYGDTLGNYISGELDVFKGEIYTELKRRLVALEML